MHGAPAVSYPVGRSRFQGWLVAVAGGAGGILGLTWFVQANPGGWRLLAYFVCWLIVLSAAIRRWQASPSGSLRWDGQDWTWNMPGKSERVWPTVFLDMQSFLLLCLHGERGSRVWVWPQRADRASRWLALRRAVYASVAVGDAAHPIARHNETGR